MNITGRPGSPGQASGEVRFLTQDNVDDLDGDNIVAIDGQLDPKLILQLDGVAGVIAQKGGMTSHGVVIARELGIPCVCGLQDRIDSVSQGSLVSIDGSSGEIEVKDG